MIKINKIVPPKAELFNPKNESLGFVENELEFNDIRIQIKRNSLVGYYFKFNKHIIPIKSSGEINDWVGGFYDQLDEQYKILFGF